MSSVELYYSVCFGASLMLTMLYMMIWHKHFDVHITLIFVLAPITNFAHLLLSQTRTLDAALTAQKVIYAGCLYQMFIILLTVMSLCRIRITKPKKLILFLLTTAVYVSTLTMGKSKIFYSSVRFRRVHGTSYLIKEYAFMHTVCYMTIILYFILSIAAILYSYFKKSQVSKKMLMLMFLPEVICIFAFFGGRMLFPEVELLPIAFTFAQAVYLIISYRMTLYDITDSGIESLVQMGTNGFISFDFSMRYIGSNDTAKQLIPELADMVVDRPVKDCGAILDTVVKWVIDFSEDESKNVAYYEKGDKIYRAEINYLHDGRKRKGYQIFLTDDTQNRKYVALIENYNNDLTKQVDEKTSHIIAMHNNLIMSMATMVESRDNSTGGHIKRTSECVRILIDEIKKDNIFGLTEDFCKNIIKAAPMHDLGKIAVDDAILRKPGRFEPWEFEKMKAHAAEGARIVHEVLKDTDDYEFHIIAENVAHYHHERWDGSGYPEGLKGDEIPLEARIMAIADVYDALVSKRVYKESMSFEQANEIIMGGMGKHFDKRLEPYYVSARPKLEAYYSGLKEN